MQHWQEVQRVGIAAYYMLAQGTIETSPGSNRLRPVGKFRELNKILLHQIELLSAGTVTPALFTKFPPFILHLLKQTEKLSFADSWKYLPLINKAFAILDTTDDTGSTPLFKAKLLAYHALLGRCDASRWSRLGSQIFGKDWRPLTPSSIDEIDNSFDKLRHPYSTTNERCGAIGCLTKILNRQPYWHQIENILYSNQFCFPLLVTEYARETKLGRIAFGLPIAVDIDFDNRRRNEAIHQGIAREVSQENRIIAEWTKGKISSLDKSLKVGKELWRAKHGNNGDFREIVKEASAIFDFSVAQQVIAPLGDNLDEELHFDNRDWNDRWHINLTDGSAEPYFAQVILQRLLGKSTVISSAITGLIGDQILFIDEPSIEDKTDKDSQTNKSPRNPSQVAQQLQLNYKFEAPDNETLRNKLRYVFATHTYERIALPRSALKDIDRSVRKDQNVEVRFAEDMQTLADIVQVKGWRQYQYIRSPDVSWIIHSRLGRETISTLDGDNLERLIKTIGSNQSAILELGDDYSPILVGAAMYHINNEKRKELQPTPPSLSWAFIRLLENEQDTWFWELIWECIGASSKSFDELIRNSKPDQIVQAIEKALNKFSPDIDNPSHRSPDIIVVIGSDTLKVSIEKTHNPTTRPYLVWEILKRLATKLDATAYTSIIGRTRIILVPGQTQEAVEPENSLANEINDKERRYLEMLSVFKNGFSQYAATLLASHEYGDEFKGRETRERILEEFLNKGWLRYGQGVYHIPSKILALIQMPSDYELMAKRHYLAGISFAPYVVGDDYSSMAMDVAFSPVNIHEAVFHLSEADNYVLKTENLELKQKIREALNHVRNIEIMPSWTLLNITTGTLRRKNTDIKNKNEKISIASRKENNGTVDLKKERQMLIDEAKPIADNGLSFVEELLALDGDIGKPTHPAHLIRAASFYEAYIDNAGCRYIHPDQKEAHESKIKRLVKTALDYYDLAIKNCEYCQYIAEHDYNKLIVASWYISFTRKLQRNRGISNEAKTQVNEEVIASLEKESQKLLDSGTAIDGIELSFLGDLADIEKDHTLALKNYTRLLSLQGNNYITNIKTIGCAMLAGQASEASNLTSQLRNSGLWNDKVSGTCDKVIIWSKKHRPQLYERLVEGQKMYLIAE
jgi:hypothetical protein